MGREPRVLFLPEQGRAAFRLKRPEENIGIMPKYRVIYRTVKSFHPDAAALKKGLPGIAENHMRKIETKRKEGQYMLFLLCVILIPILVIFSLANKY